MTAPSISIVGAGIGGLTLGRALLKHGLPAVLYERKPSSSRYSYAITLHSYSYRPLLDVLDMDEMTFRRAVAVDGPVGGTGKINPKSIVHSGDLTSSSFRAHRETLERLLRQGLDIRSKQEVDEIQESPSGMVLCLQSGEKVNSDCIIGVDGPHSNVRKFTSHKTSPKVLPFVAFNGKRRVTREVWDSIYSPWMQSSNLIQIKQNGIVLQVQVNEEQKDMVSVSWVYSRPARGTTDGLHKPDRPLSRATDIPEGFFHEIGALQGLEQPFKEVFDTEKLRQDKIYHWLMRTILVGAQELAHCAEKRVFLMGDAIHAEPIVGGEGANSAIIDGVELAHCISRSGSDGFTEFYHKRYPSWETGVTKSERLIAEIHG